VGERKRTRREGKIEEKGGMKKKGGPLREDIKRQEVASPLRLQNERKKKGIDTTTTGRGAGREGDQIEKKNLLFNESQGSRSLGS